MLGQMGIAHDAFRLGGVTVTATPLERKANAGEAPLPASLFHNRRHNAGMVFRVRF